MDPFVPVHASPAPDDGGVMPCCGRTPFEVKEERMTVDPTLVTCGKQAWLRVDHPDVAMGVLEIAGVKAERVDLADFDDRIILLRLPDTDDDPQEVMDGLSSFAEDLKERGSKLIVATMDIEIAALDDENLAMIGLQRIPEGN